VQLANLSNFICTHQGYCHPNCYERQRRSCSRLIASLRKMYESLETSSDEGRNGNGHRDGAKDKMKRRVKHSLCVCMCVCVCVCLSVCVCVSVRVQ
jgi:hypothetical protein